MVAWASVALEARSEMALPLGHVPARGEGVSCHVMSCGVLCDGCNVFRDVTEACVHIYIVHLRLKQLDVMSLPVMMVSVSAPQPSSQVHFPVQ